MFRKCLAKNLVKNITRRQLRAPGGKEKVHKVEDRVEAARMAVC